MQNLDHKIIRFLERASDEKVETLADMLRATNDPVFNEFIEFLYKLVKESPIVH